MRSCRTMEKMKMRQQVLLDHLKLETGRRAVANLVSSICSANDSAPYARTSDFLDDVVIVAAYRTAICRAKRGGFKDTFPDDLLAPVLRAVVERTRVDPAEVGDIVIGSVLAPGAQRASECRMAAFFAGFPETVPVRTVNRQCSSGLQAVADVVAAIKADFYDIGIEGGLESMSVNPIAWEGSVNPRVDVQVLLPDHVSSKWPKPVWHPPWVN